MRNSIFVVVANKQGYMESNTIECDQIMARYVSFLSFVCVKDVLTCLSFSVLLFCLFIWLLFALSFTCLIFLMFRSYKMWNALIFLFLLLFFFFFFLSFFLTVWDWIIDSSAILHCSLQTHTCKLARWRCLATLPPLFQVS